MPQKRSPTTSVSWLVRTGDLSSVSIHVPARQPPLYRDGESNRLFAALRHDVEKPLGLSRVFQVEIVLADDAFRIARLQGGFPH